MFLSQRCIEGLSVQDSLLFAIDELCLRQLRENPDADIDETEEFDQKLEELSAMIGNAGSCEKKLSLPESFDLSIAAHPKPFNSATAITIQLPEEGLAQVRIVDINGRIIENLVKRELPAGSHNMVWNAEGQPSGQYFIQAKVGAKSAVKAISLIK